jgi:hypothetical protein
MEQETTDNAPEAPELIPGWSEKVSRDDMQAKMPDAEQAPRNFWQKIAPKSTRGRVVFAAGTAQLVSFGVAILAGLYFKGGKNGKPKPITDLEDKFIDLFGKYPEHRSGFLRANTWKGFFDEAEYANFKSFSDPKLETHNTDKKHRMIASKLVEFLLLNAVDAVSTVLTRAYFDKRLELNLGTKKIIKSQIVDSSVALGAMIAIPRFTPLYSSDLRTGIREGIQKVKVPESFESNRDKIAETAGFNFVNITIPNTIGFLAGLSSMLSDADYKEKMDNLQRKVDQLEQQKNCPTL